MRTLCALFIAIGLVAIVSDRASAQASASGGASSQTFNPFATFSLSRFTFNSLGFLQVGPSNPFAITTSTSSAGGGESSDDVPQPVVVRPPYRPPVRSPYRPPPRPPF